MIPDDFFANPPDNYLRAIPRHQRDRISAAWRRSQRFEFSEEASRVSGRLKHEAPDLIVKHREFAIPPFTTMYVEADSQAFFRDAGLPIVPTADERFGYLIDGKDIFIFAAGSGTNSISPWFYRLGENTDQHVWELVANDRSVVLHPPPTPMSKLEQADFLKLAMLIGICAETPSGLTNALDIVQSASLKPMFDMEKAAKGGLGHMLGGSVGDLSNMWTFLLWLNQPKRIQYTDQPSSRRIERGKLKVYSAHRVVDIELGKARSIPRFFLAGADRTPSRRHDVRGSFHHRGGLEHGCGHEYGVMPEREQLWECRKCQRRRWWVREHERGDITRGRVVHDYAVSAGDQKSPLENRGA